MLGPKVFNEVAANLLVQGLFLEEVASLLFLDILVLTNYFNRLFTATFFFNDFVDDLCDNLRFIFINLSNAFEVIVILRRMQHVAHRLISSNCSFWIGLTLSFLIIWFRVLRLLILFFVLIRVLDKTHVAGLRDLGNNTRLFFNWHFDQLHWSDHWINLEFVGVPIHLAQFWKAHCLTKSPVLIDVALNGVKIFARSLLLYKCFFMEFGNLAFVREKGLVSITEKWRIPHIRRNQRISLRIQIWDAKQRPFMLAYVWGDRLTRFIGRLCKLGWGEFKILIMNVWF